MATAMQSAQSVLQRNPAVDKRMHTRLGLHDRGIAATLATDTMATATTSAALLDLSAGGCALVAAHALDLAPGALCRVDLPVTGNALTSYPARVISVERHRSPQRAIVRVRFRPLPVQARHMLMAWMACMWGQTAPSSDVWRRVHTLAERNRVARAD